MVEPSASYLNAPWWMVDSCTATIREKGMPPGSLFVQGNRRSELERTRGIRRKIQNKAQRCPRKALPQCDFCPGSLLCLSM